MIEKAQKEATYDLWQPPFVSVFSYIGQRLLHQQFGLIDSLRIDGSRRYKSIHSAPMHWRNGVPIGIADGINMGISIMKQETNYL